MAKLADREHAELLMLYRNAVDDIDRTKRDQWSQFYAILLAQGAIGGFSRTLGTTSHKASWLAITLLMLLGVASIVIHQLRLWRLRRLIDERYAKLLEDSIKQLFDTKEAEPLHRVLAPMIMFAILLGTFYFVTMVVLPGLEPVDKR